MMGFQILEDVFRKILVCLQVHACLDAFQSQIYCAFLVYFVGWLSVFSSSMATLIKPQSRGLICSSQRMDWINSHVCRLQILKFIQSFRFEVGKPLVSEPSWHVAPSRHYIYYTRANTMWSLISVKVQFQRYTFLFWPDMTELDLRR